VANYLGKSVSVNGRQGPIGSDAVARDVVAVNVCHVGVAIESTATEKGSSPAGKGEPGTGVRAPLEAMPKAEMSFLPLFTT
jgi:hypothetical protein